MTSAFHRLIKRLIGAAIALGILLGLILAPLGESAYATRNSMSGNYIDDTISVARDLKETISIPTDQEGRKIEEEEALGLITDYISRYRNRSQANGSLSFTTMQTALNAMAGHYKTFRNRPLPEELKERLNKELTKAEQLASKES